MKMRIHTFLPICGLLAISVHALPARERGVANESTQSGDLLSVAVNGVQDMLEGYADVGDSGSEQHKTEDGDSGTAGNSSQETIIDDIEAAFEKATQRVEQLVSTAVEELKESFKNFLESFSANEQEDFRGEHQIRKPIDEDEDEDEDDYDDFDEYSGEEDGNEDSAEDYSSDEDYDSDESNEADDESNEDEYDYGDDSDEYVDAAEEDKLTEPPVPSANDVRGNELGESSSKNH